MFVLPGWLFCLAAFRQFCMLTCITKLNHSIGFATHLQWVECIDLVQEDTAMIGMKDKMNAMVMEGKENGALEMMKGMGTPIVEREIVMGENLRNNMGEIGMGMMTPGEELEVLMTISMDQGVGVLTEMEIVLTMMMTVIQLGMLVSKVLAI